MLPPCHSVLFPTQHSTRSSCPCRPATRQGRRRWRATRQALRWRRSLLARGCAQALCVAAQHCGMLPGQLCDARCSKLVHCSSMACCLQPLPGAGSTGSPQPCAAPRFAISIISCPLGSALLSCTALWHVDIKVSTGVWCCCLPHRYACCQGVRQCPPAHITARAACVALRTPPSCRQGMRPLWPTPPSEWGTEAGQYGGHCQRRPHRSYEAVQ